MNYIIMLLSELEREILSCGNALWSKRIDTDKCMGLLEKIVKALPKTMDEADIIVAEKERILDSARQTAQEIVDNAEQQAYNSIDSSIVRRRAESVAAQIKKDAERACEEMTVHHQAEIASMYEDFEKYVADMLAVVRRNKRTYVPKPDPPPTKKRSYSKSKL